MATRLEYGLARVRISHPSASIGNVGLVGEETLLVPPVYERHIFVDEAPVISGDLWWLTYRMPIWGRERPDEFGPILYKMRVKDLEGEGVKEIPISIPNPPFTGIYVGPPINGYIPAPLLCYPAGITDTYVSCSDDLRPNIYPYAFPRLKPFPQEKDGNLIIGTDYILTEVLMPASFSHTSEGVRLLGSTSLVMGAGLHVIPKKVKIKYYDSQSASWKEKEVAFPREMVSWWEVRRNGTNVLGKLRKELFQIPANTPYEVEYPTVDVFSYSDPVRGKEYTSKVVDGYFLGLYVDFVSSLSMWYTFPPSRPIEYTFGFGLFPDAPINLDAAALSATSIIRIFWGGYYMLEFLPQQPPVFYFFPEGYSVPTSPLISTETFSFKNEDFKNDKLYGGAHRKRFMLKNLRPIVNGEIEAPFVYMRLLPDMNIAWGTKQIQPAATYDFYIIMHLRDHVCIFRYRDILRGISEGGRVDPIFTFNPIEYLYYHFGEKYARWWFRSNRNSITAEGVPPRMWWFNASGFVVIPYLQFPETAIATKPTVVIPSLQSSIRRIEEVMNVGQESGRPILLGKVTCGGIDSPFGSTRDLIIKRTPPIVFTNVGSESKVIKEDGFGRLIREDTDVSTGEGLSLTASEVAKTGASAPLVGSNDKTLEYNIAKVRPFLVPSPYYLTSVELRRLGEPIKNFLLGRGTASNIVGGSQDDIDFLIVIMRTANEHKHYGEISGRVPYPEIARLYPSVPSPDGFPYVDYSAYRDKPAVEVLSPSPVVPRPPVLIGADIYVTPVFLDPLEPPNEITAVFPAPRASIFDTSVESVAVTLSEGIGNSSAVVKLLVDETAFHQFQPAEVIGDLGSGRLEGSFIGFPSTGEFSPIAAGGVLPRPHPLLYRRIVIELGYVTTSDGYTDAHLYPVFDGIITSVSATINRSVGSGRQMEVTIRAVDIFSRLKMISTVGLEPIMDNWTPASAAYWATAAAGLSPLRVGGISGFPLGARLAWWVGSEQIIREQILGSYGFPILNIPEQPRARLTPGSSLADNLERLGAEGGCEFVVSPTFHLFFEHLTGRSVLPLMWKGLLKKSEIDFFLSPSTRFIDGGQQIFDMFRRASGWRSVLQVVPAGYYSPIPTWVFVVGPYDYSTSLPNLPNPYFLSPHGELGYIVVPDFPYMRGLVEINTESSIWSYPTSVVVEGNTIWNLPLYYIWSDRNREGVVNAPLYTGFRMPKYVVSANITTPQQAKAVAIKNFFGGKIFPPINARLVLSGGIPFLYPRMSVALYSSDRQMWTQWVVRSVTYQWEAGATPRTVVDVSLPHPFPLAVPL